MGFLHKIAVILVSLSWFVVTSTEADNRQINLTLYSFSEQSREVEVLDAVNVNPKSVKKTLANNNKQPVLTLNRSSHSPITTSKKQLGIKDLMAISLDNKGNELSRQILKNPLYFRAEVFDERTGAMTFAKDIKRESAVLNLIVPDDDNLHTIKIYEAKQVNEQLELQQLHQIMPQTPIDSAAMNNMPMRQTFSQNSANVDVVKVLNSGDSLNRVDLVFLSEGYTSRQLSQFSTDVDNIVQGYFNVSPYKEYKNLYNVWRVEVASNQTGAGIGGRPIDTQFGANFGCYNIERLLCVDEGKVLNYINSIMPSHQADQIVVVVNTSTYGGAGGTVATMSLAPAAIDLALHEVGHSFGQLADEYTNGTCITSEPFEPNVTTSANGQKWSHWLSASNVDAYEGARYCNNGMYRPTYDSMMNHLGVPFYQVNEEALVLRTYDFVNPIDNVSPINSQIELTAGQQQSFYVDTVEPIPDTIEANWYIDQTLLASGKQIAINADDLGIGTFTLVVNVKDTTNKVIKDDYQSTQASYSWTVTVNGSCNALAPSELIAMDITNDDFLLSWKKTANATGYLVEVNEGNGWFNSKTVQDNNTRLTGFRAADIVSVRVRSLSSCGSSEPSSVIEVSLNAEYQIPAIPTNLIANNIRNNALTLTWQGSAQATSYNIERWLDSEGWVNVGETNQTQITVNGLLIKDQWLHVKANNSIGSSAYSDYLYIVLADTPTCSAITMPEKPSAYNINASGFSLQWQQTSGADLYQVQLWQAATSSWRTIDTLSATRYDLSNLTSKIAYARIVATNRCDDEPQASDWLSVSLENTCQFAPSAPTDLSFSGANSVSFTANWQAVEGATSYQVQLWNGQWLDAGASSTNSLVVDKLNATSADYFQVKASNACGDSDYSYYFTVP
jgi:hypothetical protein